MDFLSSLLFWKTEAEKKRDRYEKLYDKLSRKLEKFDKEMKEANEKYRDYQRFSPILSSTKIPSNDFVVKRTELNSKLSTHLNDETSKRSELVKAIHLAYERYLHYKKQAIIEGQKYENEKNKQ